MTNTLFRHGKNNNRNYHLVKSSKDGIVVAVCGYFAQGRQVVTVNKLKADDGNTCPKCLSGSGRVAAND